MRRLIPAVALVALLASQVAVEAGDILDDARRTAAASRLLARGCLEWKDGSLPAWFSYEPEGSSRGAQTAVLLPAPPAEVAAVLEGFDRWHEWAVVAPDGTPNLLEVRFVPEKSRGWIRVGKSKVEGSLQRDREGEDLALRIEKLGGRHIKDVFLDAAALEVPGCGEWSLAVLGIRWRFGIGARLMAGDIAKSMPALFLIAVRDDLAARVLARTGRLDAVLGAAPRVTDGASYLRAAPPGGKGAEEWPGDGDRLLYIEPGAVATTAAAIGPMNVLVEKASGDEKIKVETWFDAFWKAQAGTRSIGLYMLAVEGEDEPRSFLVGSAQADLHYRVIMEKNSFSASFGPVMAPQP